MRVAASAYIRSRQVQNVPPPSCVRPRSARWNACECALAKPGRTTPGSRRSVASLATVGKLRVDPNGVNAIPSQVTAWLDVRAESESAVHAVLASLKDYSPAEESWTPVTTLDADLADVIADALKSPPRLGTGAGHDAGILAAAGIPTAMLFVRNPTGVSHSPAEHAGTPDCLAGVTALAEVLTDLAGPA